MTQTTLKLLQKTQSEPQIRRYNVVAATQHPHDTTIKKTRLEENRTIQDNGQDSLETSKLDIPTSSPLIPF